MSKYRLGIIDLGDGFTLEKDHIPLTVVLFRIRHHGRSIGTIGENHEGGLTYSIHPTDVMKQSLHLDVACKALNFLRGLKRLIE